jgi:SAM-dependent methyltransferase
MSFAVSGDSYDRFMGRFSQELAPAFADFAGVGPGLTALDVGCGSGVFTEELARRLGAESVAGVDPSPLVEAAAVRVPGADLRQGAAEALPWPDDSFDAALAQLVVHFMDDPVAGVAEMARVTRAGGTVAACTWDFAGGGMELLGTFWNAVRAVDPEAPTEIPSFGTPEQLDALWRGQGLDDVGLEPLTVTSRYESFDEVWDSFLLGVGPAGQFATRLEPERQAAVRQEYHRLLGEPAGALELTARASAVRGRVPE